MDFKRPTKLRAGDTVAVLSPSWGGPACFPAIFDLGLATLRSVFGLSVREFPGTRADPDWLYHHPEARAADINAAFADPTVRAIIASIGGDDSVRLLPYLDADIIRANPKILLGFSDTTTLLAYCNQLGLVTFNGPSVMAGLAQLRALPPAFEAHIRQMLFEPSNAHAYQPFPAWSEGYPDWGHAETLGLVNEPQPNEEGWAWVQGQGRVEGTLFGGCIEVLEMMKGTRFWPESAFWDGKLLFLETSEDAPAPTVVKYMLRNYGMQGVFERIAGLLIGRPSRYTSAQKQELIEAAVAVLAVEFGRPDLPLVANLDFGHTDPQWILPLGVRAALDFDRRTFTLLEAPVAG